VEGRAARVGIAVKLRCASAWYASRLPGEPAGGVEDYHFHPIEPRNARLYLGYKF
jgi:hypothetical protein